MRQATRRSRAFRPEPTALEGRTLLAAGITARLARGVLTVTGTAGDDVIAVDVTRPRGPRAANRGVVIVGGVGRLPVARVRQIVIDAGDGDDTIRVTQVGRRPTPATIDGGAGDDRIDAGPEARLIPDDDGNDIINGVAQFNTTQLQPQPQPRPQPQPTPTPTPSPSDPADPVTALEQAIINLINRARLDAGLQALSVNPSLTQAAQIQAANMARLNQMAHTLPGTSTPTLSDRAAATGYRFRLLGENIAYNYRGAAEVVAGWLASPGHRANILDAGFHQTSVAVRFNAAGEPYYAQVFGSPA